MGMPLRIMGFLILGFMLVCYPLAQVLPVSAGWENGLIENTQVAVLIASAFVALYWCVRAKNIQIRWFWIMLIPLWLILVGREVSWGASILTPALGFNPETGPIYSSSQLSYRSEAHMVVLFLVLCSVAIFLATKQYQTLMHMVRRRGFPVTEMVLAIVAAALCTIAEGHAPISLFSLSEGQMQVLEELFELCVYLFAFAGQLRFGSQLNIVSSNLSLSMQRQAQDSIDDAAKCTDNVIGY